MALQAQIIYVNLTTAEINWVANGSSGDLQLPETTAPAGVAATGQIYVKSSDHKLYFKDQGGTEYLVAPSSAAINFASGEIPSGTIDGSNKTFTLAHSPNPVLTLILILGGGGLGAGGIDYTLSGSTITMNTAPPNGQTWTGAWYQW